MKLQTIALIEIDFNDETYLLTPIPSNAPPPGLLASIKRVGILHPPLVEEVDRGRYRILAGRSRLLAAQKLHLRTCQCRVVDNSATPLEILSLLVEELLAAKTPSLMEQAIFLKKARAWFDLEEAAHRFLPMLGYEPHPFQAEKLLRLNNLEEVIQEAVHVGSLDAKVAWELEKLAFADRLALFEIIMALKLSVGNQKKITLISREVAVRSQTTIAAFLAQQESQDILNNAELNIPQKTAHFMAWLHAQQFPRLTQAEEEFRNFCRHLNLPAKASLQHAPFFEKDELNLTLTFKDRQELLAKMPAIAAALAEN